MSGGDIRGRGDVASLGVKYVGSFLFGLFFMFSNFYPLDLQNGTCVTIENLEGSMSTNLTENGPHLI